MFKKHILCVNEMNEILMNILSILKKINGNSNSPEVERYQHKFVQCLLSLEF